MKRKNLETGVCVVCGKLTHYKVPHMKGFPRNNNFYCGCLGLRAI